MIYTKKILSMRVFDWAEETSKVELTPEEQSWKTQSAAHEETDYLFENLNDCLIFIVIDLLDTYHDEVLREQDDYETRTAHLIPVKPLRLW